MRRLGIVVGIGVLTFAVSDRSSARPPAEQVQTLLRHELELTREATRAHRDRVTLDRARASLGYTTRVLDHASEESLRRLASYRTRREARETHARARARALYKLARGGVARLLFEGLEPEGASTARVTLGRALRSLVRADAKLLATYRTAERRAQAELVTAAREQQELAALTMVQAMQEHVLLGIEAALDPELARVGARRRRAIDAAAASGGIFPHRDELAALRRSQQELASFRGLRGEPRLVRPVSGGIVARFGEHLDPVYRIPVLRNGVELRARGNETVRAFAEGRVALVGELPGYAHVVVLDHGEGQYSLTGRLWGVTVEEGQTVKRGQVLGRVAPKTIDDGLGRTVYFEVRHGEQPVDPAPYLRRAKAP